MIQYYYGKIIARIDCIEEKVFGLMEKMYNEMINGFSNINGKFDSLEKKIDKSTMIIETMQNKIEELSELQESNKE
jgi:peptidoglycan hydrolase CwlO-like protein